MKLKISIVICMAVLLFGGCKQQAKQNVIKVQVGVVYYDQSDTFLTALIDCLKSELQKAETDDIDISVMVRTSSGSQKTQNEQIIELIEAGCNVLCVNLVDRSNPAQIIDTARDKDIPIIFFNREPVSEDMHQWDKLYYVGADAVQSGVMQGEIAASLIQDGGVDRNKDGVIQYVVLEGEAGHQDTIVRTENSVNTIKSKNIELEKLGYQIANWNRAQAQSRMEQLIAQYQSKIELVLANNDDMALGAVDAYKKLNYTEDNWPVILGVDGTDVGLDAVENGYIDGTVYNDKERQAEAMATLAVALITQKGIEKIPFQNEKYIYMPYYKVLSSTKK